MWHWTDYCEIYESDVKKKEIQEVTKWMEKDYTGQKRQNDMRCVWRNCKLF